MKRTFKYFIYLLCYTFSIAAYSQTQTMNFGGSQQIQYNLATGEATYTNGNAIISDFYARIRIPEEITSKMYASREYSFDGVTHVITLTDPDYPTMEQRFTIDTDNQIRIAVAISDDADITCNHITPLITTTFGGSDVGTGGTNIRAMKMPSIQPNGTRWAYPSINGSGSSYNVTTYYDADAKNGFVIGAITHDTWRSAIYYAGSSNKLDKIAVVSGAKSEWDVVAHGSLVDTEIESATFLLGYYDDYRDGLESFAAAVAEYHPKLGKSSPEMDWDRGGLVSWKSWGNGSAKDAQTDESLLKTIEVMESDLMSRGWHNAEGAAVVNFAASAIGIWGIDFINEVQEDILDPNENLIYGRYNTQVMRSGVDKDALFFNGTYGDYTWGDVLLKDFDGDVLVINSKNICDVSHPAFLAFTTVTFENLRADEVQQLRMDFQQYAIFEGDFADPNIKTGVQAYNQYMKTVTEALENKTHINLAISPYFPTGYAHSHRVTGDTDWTWSTVEYSLNALAGNWWMGNGVLFDLLDPGDVDFNPTPANDNINVSRSQMTSAVIMGYCQTSDDIADDDRRELHKIYFGDAEVNEVLRLGAAFRPIPTTTGATPNVFYHVVGDTAYAGVFNHTTSALSLNVDLDEILDGFNSYNIEELWDNDIVVIDGSSDWNINLEAKGACLYKITPSVDNSAFIPDPDKKYYIDNLEWGVRVGANGSEDAISYSTADDTGENVQWVITPSPTNGYYYMDCVGGGNVPRIRSDQSINADMHDTTSIGTWTRWKFTAAPTTGYYYVDTENISDFMRLHVNGAPGTGDIRTVSTSSGGTWTQWRFTEVPGKIIGQTGYIKVKLNGEYWKFNTSSLLVSSTTSAPDENSIFTMLQGPQDSIVLIQASNGVNLRYYDTDRTRSLSANGGTGTLAQYYFVDLGNNEFTLQPVQNDRRVRLDEANGDIDGFGWRSENTIFEWVSETEFSLKSAKITNSNVELIDSKTDLIEIYPNPATDKLCILHRSDAKEDLNVRIFSILGQEAHGYSLNSGRDEIDISKLKPGLYVLSINYLNKIQTIKFLKQE